MSSDPTDPLQAVRRENRLLRERVADLERQLKRSDDAAPVLDATLSVREALLSEAEHIAHMGSWVWDVPTNSVYWTDELFRILGYDPQHDTASTERFFERVHPEDRERVRRTSEHSIVSGIAEQVDYRVLHADGVVRYVTMNGALLFNADGQLTRAVGTVLDVTEAREAARAAQKTALLLMDAQRIAKMGSFELDLATQQLSWSAELYRILEVEPRGPPSVELFLARLHEEDQARIAKLIDRSLTSGEVEPSRARVICRDGRVRHLDMMAIAVRTEAGELSAVRGTLADVTEVVQLEAQFHQSQKMEAVGQLAGGLAHDYNNLLMVIIGNAESLLQEGESQALRDILTAAESAAEITGRLLAFTRRIPESDTVCVLEAEVDRSRSLLERALGNHTAIRFQSAELACPVLAPAGQIQQMLVNLCLNARDAMPQGGAVTLATRHEQLGALHAKAHGVEAGDYVVLSVADTGIGMNQTTRARAFEPFFTTKPVGRGTGLGLAMVFGTMKRCGGFVELHSELGKGATFELWFPRTAGRPDGVRTPTPAAAQAGLTALLVDDDASVAHVTKIMLERAGYQVRVAANGTQALALWSKQAADVLITDVEMPGMSGVELSARIRRDTPWLPVLFITGHSTEHLETGRAVRMAALAKPFRGPELLGALRDLLARA